MLNHYLTNTLGYNPAKCINCGMCLDVCPHGVFAPVGNAVHVVRGQACMECGACQLNCPTQAISVESGVGCAAAMIQAALTGSKEATCGFDEGGESSGGDGVMLPRTVGDTSRQGRWSWLGWLRSPGAGEGCSPQKVDANAAARKAEC
jgi:NAD-dependent dihydropyrimidine dehydrogenase PreA subunit